MLQKVKSALAEFAVLSLRTITIAIPAKSIQKALKWFRFTPLRSIVFNVWARVLIYSGYRVLKADWSLSFWERPSFFGQPKRDPIYGIQYVLDVMLLGETNVDDILEKLKFDIYENEGGMGDKLERRLSEVIVINEIEASKALSERHYFLSGSKIARHYFRSRMERAHAMRIESSVDLYARSYLASINYDPNMVTRVCSKTLSPNGLHHTSVELINLSIARLTREDYSALVPQVHKSSSVAKIKNRRLEQIELLAGAFSEDSTNCKIRLGLERQKINHLLELGEFDKVGDIIETYKDHELFRSSAVKLSNHLNQNFDGLESLEDIIHSTLDGSRRSVLLGELAEQLEENRDFEGSLAVYRACYRENVQSSLNISQASTWRYVHNLLATERWSEAISVMRSAQRYMWRFFWKLNKKSSVKLLENDYRLSDEGGLVLGCWGLGDEFFRLGLWHQMANKSAKWAFTCEPRLEKIFKRSFPDAEIIVNSRTTGPNSVSELDYWKDREGITTQTDLARLTLPVVKSIRKYKNLIISETMFYEFIRRHCKIETPIQEQLLLLDENENERVKKWLDTLPEGLNVAISWRSGKRSGSRDKSYTSLDEWGDILSLPGINFINLQYSDLEEEKQEARDMFGAKIYDMPGVNRKHDIDTLMAICVNSDVVIAPCTAVREMAGACGAVTWSLTTTPFLPDLWRIENDSDRDKIFPSMRHFTSMEYNDKYGVLAAMGAELSQMSKTRDRFK